MMRFLRLRTVSMLTSVALIAATAAGAPFALAAAGGPTVVLSSATASTTNASSVSVTATFSEAVTGLTLAGIGVTNGTASSLSGTTTTYTFNVAPTADGVVTVQLNADAANATANPGKGNQASNILTFTSDKTGPVISGIADTPSSTSATITWNTNEGATGQVAYGTTSAYTASSSLVSTFSTSHTATLTGLSASTQYHFQITSTDSLGNTATSSDATFMTTAASTSAPVISNVAANPTGTSTALITWNTDSAANSRVFYGPTAGYGSSSTLNATATTSHSVALSGLTQATLYHYEVVSSNAGGTATSSDQVFTTDSTASSTPLAVTGIDAVRTTATADGTFANGWAWVIHFIVPSNETFFRMKFADFTMANSSSTVPIANNMRYSSPQSSNASTSDTAIVETNNNYGGDLILTGDASSTSAGRQVDVTVETAVPLGTTPGVYSTTFGALSTTTP